MERAREEGRRRGYDAMLRSKLITGTMDSDRFGGGFVLIDMQMVVGCVGGRGWLWS